MPGQGKEERGGDCLVDYLAEGGEREMEGEAMVKLGLAEFSGVTMSDCVEKPNGKR